jgi:hypothetical protein
MEGKEAARDQAEGKYLPPVGVAGELKVEGAEGVLLHQGLMLEENGKAAAAAGENFPIRQPSLRSKTADSRVVDSCKINRTADGRNRAPERGKPGFVHEIDGFIETGIEFVVTGHGKFPIAGTDLPKLRRGVSHTVELAIHKVARGHEKIRRRLLNLPEHPGKPLSPHHDADMNVGDLNDSDLSCFLRYFRRTDLDPFRTDLARLEEAVSPDDQRCDEWKEKESPGCRQNRADIDMKDKTGGINQKTKEIEEERYREKEQDDRHPDVAGPRHESDQSLDTEPFQHTDNEGGYQAQSEQYCEDDLGGGAGSESRPELQKKIKMKTTVQQEERQEKEDHGHIAYRVSYTKGEVNRSFANLLSIFRDLPPRKNRRPADITGILTQ